MNREPLDIDLVNAEIVRDGDDPKHLTGNFLGILGIPPQGGRYWHAANGDYGYCETDEEALREIAAAWKR